MFTKKLVCRKILSALLILHLCGMSDLLVPVTPDLTLAPEVEAVMKDGVKLQPSVCVSNQVYNHGNHCHKRYRSPLVNLAALLNN